MIENLTDKEIEKATERFLTFLPNQGEGCWEWAGGRTKRGYGAFNFKNNSMRAHRLAIELLKKEVIPAGMVVMHTCHNPPCCNPDHLTVGTQGENLEMSRRDGRMSGGPNAPLKDVRSLIRSSKKFKKCSKCKVVKSVDEFHKHSNTFDGKRDRCKACHNKENRHDTEYGY